MPTLYQFPFSHFCEKARWAMDYHRYPYEVHNLLPLFHVATTKRVGGKTSVPLLVGDDLLLQESTEIIDFLDRTCSDHSLTPRLPEVAKAAREWERWLDEEIGITLRQWFYGHVLPDAPRAFGFLLKDVPESRQHRFRRWFPVVRFAMQRKMRITESSAASAFVRLESALDILDATITRQRFLAGDVFSRADLTAAALLSPTLAFDRSLADLQQAFPPVVFSWWQRFNKRPCYDWLCGLYRDYRAPSVAVTDQTCV